MLVIALYMSCNLHTSFCTAHLQNVGQMDRHTIEDTPRLHSAQDKQIHDLAKVCTHFPVIRSCPVGPQSV